MLLNIALVVYYLFQFGAALSLHKVPMCIQTNGNKVSVLETRFLIIDINSFNAIDMDFSIDYCIDQSWSLSVDEFNKFYLNASKEIKEAQVMPITVTKIGKGTWIPDTSVINSKVVKDNRKPKIKIKKEKDFYRINYYLRGNAKIACPMDFKFYPFDVQKCKINISSQLYDTRLLKFVWSSNAEIDLSNDFDRLSSTMLQHMLTKQFNSSTTTGESGSEFSLLWIEISFRRRISYYVMQVYIPSILMVMISYCSFWLGYDVMPARVILNVTTVLALVTQYTSVKNGLPPVSYATAVDIWMIVCMVFIFFSICVLTIGFSWAQKDFAFISSVNPAINLNISPYKWAVKPVYNNALQKKKSNGKVSNSVSSTTVQRPTPVRIRSKALSLDSWCRTIHPIIFTLFSLTYWAFFYIKDIFSDGKSQ